MTERKAFQVFSIHEYMDEYPTEDVRVMTKGEAEQFADHMSKYYSGGTTTYVKEMSAQEAKLWLKEKVLEEIDTFDSITQEQVANMLKLYYETYIK